MKPAVLRFGSSLPRPAFWVVAAVLVSLASCAHDSSSPESCEGELSLCAGDCVDTSDDPSHCGGCDNACAPGRTCVDGQCAGGEGVGGDGGGGGAGGSCERGLSMCSGSCFDLQTDDEHCGSCNERCDSERECVSGACACSGGLADCGGRCFDLQTDREHCGRCATECNGTQVCEDGACTCAEGQTDCGGGLCADLQSNPQHCGACDVACDPGFYCREGTCSCIVGAYQDIGSTVPQTVTGTTVGAGSGYDLTCVAAGSTEQVVQFTAPEAGTYSFDTIGSAYDTALSVIDAASCDELACNDDASGSQSRVTTVLDAGDVVLVVVTGFNSAMGDFTLNVGVAAPPVCPSGNLGATVPATVTGNTAALGDAIAPACGTTGSPDASYTFTAPADGRYIFDTFGSTFNTILELHAGDCSGPVLDCSDDSFMGEQSRIDIQLTAGQTVVAVVDGFAGAAGPFTLNVAPYAPPPCPMIDLGSTVPQTVTGNNTGLENYLEAPCGASGGSEVTYSFTAPADALYTFDTFGSSFDTVLHVHDGTCGGASLGCNDDTGGVQSRVPVLLSAGQTVVVVVDGYGAFNSGPFTLNVTQTIVPPCPSIDLGSTVPQTVTGTTAGIADVLAPSCIGASSGELSYRFTAPSDGTYLFDTFGSSFDTVLFVRDGACTGPELACNNDASGGLDSRVAVSLTAGQSVVVFVDGYYGAAGNFTLNVTEFSGGGTCGAPIDLGSTVPQTLTGSTLAQVDSATPTCTYSAGAPDTVFSFTAPTDGIYLFDTQGSAYNTALYVRDGSCTGAELACNDDTGTVQSAVNVSLTAGQTVFVIVDGYNTEAGDYVLNVSQFAGGATCASPIDLGSTVPQTLTGSTLGQIDLNSPLCSYSNAPDAVYAFTAPADGLFFFDTQGSSYNTVLHVHSPACNGPEIGCNDDSGGLQSVVSTTLTAGQQVYVIVDGYDAQAGDYVLNVAQFTGTGTCATAVDIGSTAPQTVTGNTSLQPNSYTPGCGYSTAPDTVHRFTAPATRSYTIDTVGSTFDTVLSVRDGSCSGAELGCNDDYVGLQSQVTVSLTAGQVVDIVVDGFSTNSGPFTLNIH